VHFHGFDRVPFWVSQKPFVTFTKTGFVFALWRCVMYLMRSIKSIFVFTGNLFFPGRGSLADHGISQILLTIFAGALLVVGLLGLLVSTFGSSWIATLLTFFSQSAQPRSLHEGRMKLELLVAAYNEEKVIRQTLESLLASAQALRESQGDCFDLQITVGLDHCTDKTAEIVAEVSRASQFPIRSISNVGERGKWNTLLLMIGMSEAHWVALVDSGSLWQPKLLATAWNLLRESAVMAVAPSYAPSRCGLFETATWRLERMLKRMENHAGGPVSVHGATILYRRSTLLGALASLHGRSWLNDDVVVPLTLRLQNPGCRIVYLSAGCDAGWVSDVGVVSELSVEYGRRRRMVMGNLQWIRLILLPQLSVLLVASRRLFRVFWAYWILFILLGSGAEIALALRDVSGTAEIARALLLEMALTIGFITAVGGLLFSNWVRRLSVAFVSGLLVSRYWKDLNSARGVSWV
jgi:cellulose synthase/poly-beta-1,6-N-acetylglucosamine synthase-like glycosyltransferase